MPDAPDLAEFNLDLRAEIARIDRDRAETQKLAEETRKFLAESRRFDAETLRLTRENRWFPWLQLATSSGALIAAVAAFIAAILAHKS